MEERLQQQCRLSWSNRVHLMSSKRMRGLKQVHLEKNKRIAHAYLTLPDWDGMSASWPGKVQTVSITVTAVGQFPVTYVRSLCCPVQAPVSRGLSRGSSLLYVGVYYKQEDQPRNTKNNLKNKKERERRNLLTKNEPSKSTPPFCP